VKAELAFVEAHPVGANCSAAAIRVIGFEGSGRLVLMAVPAQSEAASSVRTSKITQKAAASTKTMGSNTFSVLLN
jgi:hypothetical protein